MSIVRSVLLLLVGLALVAVWGASAAANFAHGVQQSGHSPYWWVFGLASAGLDVLKAVALFGLVAAWRKSHYLAVVACLLVWTFTTAWGVRSCTGFVATILTDTASERDMHTVADKSLSKQIDDQVAQIIKLQDVKLRSRPADWDRIEGEIGRTEARLNRLRIQARTEPTVGKASPLGALLKRYGIEEDTFQLGTSIVFLLALEVAASLGLMAFAPMFGREHEEMATEITQDFIAPTPTLPPRGCGERPRSRLLRPRKAPSKTDSPLRVQALGLLQALEDKHGEGASVASAEVFKAYLALTRVRGWTGMTSLKLGQQLALLGVGKDRDEERKTYYVLPTAREKARERGAGLPT